MSPLICECNERIKELKKIVSALNEDFFITNSPEESLIIERVAENLSDAVRDIQRVASIEEKLQKM